MKKKKKKKEKKKSAVWTTFHICKFKIRLVLLLWPSNIIGWAKICSSEQKLVNNSQCYESIRF